jgi:glycosyltransferase involved in cell wall biosynthesis
MTERRILMACPNYWTSPFQVGSHHLARGFVDAGWRVGFVSDPISPLHWLGGRSPELEERRAIWRAGGIEEEGGRVWAYVPAAPVTPHNKLGLRSARLQRSWHALSLPNVVDKVRERGFGAVDILYIDSVSQLFWLDAIEHRRSVFRLADNNTGFGKSTPAMQRLEAELARRVDVVVYTAANLLSHVQSMRPRATFHLPNGVNFRHFADWRGERPVEYERLAGPIALYVGALDVWFDYALLDRTAARLPEVSFVLIGPDALARARLTPRPNLHLLGRRPYAQLPGYMHHAQVGLIPFDVARHPTLVHSINPLKLYEYMASGLPVVATEWDELRNLGSPARLARSEEDFVEAVRESVAAPPPREALVRFAEAADWTSRVRMLQERLGL